MMMVQVWLAYKKGEPRIYTRTTEPPSDLVLKWREEGFRVYYTTVYLPLEDCTEVDGAVSAEAQRVVLKDAK